MATGATRRKQAFLNRYEAGGIRTRSGPSYRISGPLNRLRFGYPATVRNSWTSAPRGSVPPDKTWHQYSWAAKRLLSGGVQGHGGRKGRDRGIGHTATERLGAHGC